MTWAINSLRRLRGSRSASLTLAVLVFVTAFVFAAAPRLLDRVADDALDAAVRGATPFQRNVQLVEETGIEASSPDPLGRVEEVGRNLEEQLPRDLGALFDDRVVVVDSIRWGIGEAANPETYVRLRIQARVDDHIRYVAGRRPTGATKALAGQEPPPEEAPEGEPLPAATQFEAALSVESARALHVSVGQILALKPDTRDPLMAAAGRLPIRAAVQIVGLFEVNDEKERYWLDDASLARPSVRTLTPEVQFLDATAVLSPDAYPALFAEGGQIVPIRYTWRLFVDPGRISAANLDALVLAARRAETLFPAAVPRGGETTRASMRSGLRAVLDAHRSQWLSAFSLLWVTAIGPAAVALATLLLICRLAVERGRSSFAVWRSRGASGAHLVIAILTEGLVTLAPPAVVAGVLAVALIPGDPPSTTLALALGVAIVATILFAIVALRASAQAGVQDRQTLVARITSRRIAGESFLIALAIGGAYLLRERTLRSVGAGSSSSLPTSDPFIAGVPALAAVAAGIAAVRLFPLPMRLLGIVAAARRGLVPVLAARTALRTAGAAAILIVVLATVAVGAFAAVTLGHIDRAASVAAWQEVGAPFRLTAGGIPFPGTFDPRTLPGVVASAGAFRQRVTLQQQATLVDFVAIDVAALHSVVGGTDGDPNLPAAMMEPAGSTLPVIVSSQLAGPGSKLAPGEEFTMTIRTTTPTFRVAAIRDSFPGLPLTGPFIVVSRDQFRSLAPGALPETMIAFLRAPDDSAATLRDAVADHVSGAVIDSRAERSASLGDAPVLHAIAAGVAAAAAVALAYGALAIAAAIALAGAAHAGQVAYLRTLGLTRRQAIQLILFEQIPPVFIAVIAGLVLGIGLFVVLRPGLGLTALIGSPVEVPLTIEPTQLGALLAGLAGVLAIGVGLGVIVQRRAVPTAAVRRGIE